MGEPSAEKDAGRVSPSVLRQVITKAMDRAEAVGMDRRTTEDWISIEILGSPLIPLTTETPLRMEETPAEYLESEQSWFQQEYERSKARNALIPPHARMVATNPILSAHTRKNAPARVTPPGDPDA